MWYSENFLFEVNTEDNDSVIDLVFDKMPSKASLSLTTESDYKNLNKTKDSISTADRWDRWSKLVNMYEKVHKRNTNASRAYYKLYEIVVYFRTFGYLEIDAKKSFHFCEAPGGFIQATKSIFPEIDWYAQTLYTDKNIKIDGSLDIPEKWIKGGDNTGNLYNYENLEAIISTDKKFDIITADGGFDVSIDPNNQEQLHFRLIFSEVVGALSIQKKGGAFICKIFDVVTKPTGQLLTLLKRYYNKVFLIKPRSSRINCSEKYIVCTDFRDNYKGELLCYVKKWSNFCRDFGLKIDPDLKNYNSFLLKTQTKNIENALKGPFLKKEVIVKLDVRQNIKSQEFYFAFFGVENECKHIKDGTIRLCNFCEMVYI